MKKQKLFVILIVSLFIGTSFAVFTTTNTMAKAVTRAYLISPQDGDTVSGTVTITCSAAVYIYIDGVRVARKATSYVWDTTAYTDGQHQIRLKLRRTNGYYYVTVSNSGPDTTPPTINIGYPGEGSTVSNEDVMVTWSGSDSGSGIDYYEVQIDGGTWINKGTGTSHTFTGLTDGGHTINVRAWDNAGNDATDSVTFTVDTSIVVGEKYAVLAGISNYKAISD
ncbi:MAG: Ig-like domain-containing protein, partial [Candidatus Heimdallarchaeota archaeon]